jgi:putative endonuclease
MKGEKIEDISSGTFGALSEKIALEYLLSLGFVLRDKNWRAGHKEIDLIMESPNYLHIVEVRSLRAPALILPQNSVKRGKQKLLIMAASSYVRKKRILKDVSFDIVSIIYYNGKFEIDYIPNAFLPII